MTIHALFVIVLIMFIISLIGDIVLAHRLNKHTEDYDDLLTRVNNINEWCNKQDDAISMLNADAEALETSINTIQNQINKLTEPGEVTKETVKQVLDEMDVLSGSIVNGQLEIKEH